MTRYRVPFSGLTILAVAVTAAMDVQGQAKSTAAARFTDSAGVKSCTGYSLTIDSTGLDVRCDNASSTPTPTPTPTPAPTPTPTGPTASEITSPVPGSTITGGSATFVWNTGVGLEARYLVIRSGGTEYYSNYPAGHNVAGLSQAVTGLPTSGTIIVELSSYFGATTGWATKSYSYAAAAGSPTPTPSPTPSPTGGATCVNSAGQTVTEPAKMIMQPMFVGGTNNYVFDSDKYSNTGRPNIDPAVVGAQGTTQVFELPKTWGAGGRAIDGAQVAFASYIVYSGAGAQYEVAFSKCKGDFSYYKSAQAQVGYPGTTQTFQPCGVIWGSDMSVGWSIGGPSIYSCGIPAGETWYMNWRVVPGTCNNGSYTCGQTFYIPGG
jgi:hypothetical protein